MRARVVICVGVVVRCPAAGMGCMSVVGGMLVHTRVGRGFGVRVVIRTRLCLVMVVVGGCVVPSWRLRRVIAVTSRVVVVLMG
jgi:hypothetical protein